MENVSYRSKQYGDGSESAVALIAGFDGRIEHFETAARDLVKAGNDVIVYEYDNDVLLAGESSLLPNLISDLSVDFLGLTSTHKTHRYAGVSLGAGIGWNMQKMSSDALPGMYAAAGANVANLIMNNLIFRGVTRAVYKQDIKKKFESNGYGETELKVNWRRLQPPPATGFAVALGGLDYIVRSKEVNPKIEKWKQDIDFLEVIRMKSLGHTGIIKWFNENVCQLIEPAK